MFLIFLTFVLTTAVYGLVLGLALRRISRYLQSSPEGVKAVTQHVLIPLLGRPLEQESERLPTANAGDLDPSPYDAVPKNGHTASRHGDNPHEPLE
jgi:hypothetical protein